LKGNEYENKKNRGNRFFTKLFGGIADEEVRDQDAGMASQEKKELFRSHAYLQRPDFPSLVIKGGAFVEKFLTKQPKN
jgi:hypothetical protein